MQTAYGGGAARIARRVIGQQGHVVLGCAALLLSARCGTATTPPTAARLTPAVTRCPAEPAWIHAADRGGDSPPVTGDPETVLVCRYPGGTPGATSSAAADGPTWARLVNALPAVPSGNINCPADHGDRDVLYFAYPQTGQALQVDVELSGCGFVQSPSSLRRSTPDLLARLGALLDGHP